MLTRILTYSLTHRWVVLGATVALLVGGMAVLRSMQVDVFPDLTAPSVTVMTEAHGMGAVDVEQRVTFPIETALNGAPGVRRIRSASMGGLSIVWVEFAWDTDAFRARALVNERLAHARAQLPAGVDAPTMAPVASIMGEVMLLTLQSDGLDAGELRALADWEIRPRLMGLGGVANVSVIGGEVRQMQVQTDPLRLAHAGISYTALLHAAEEAGGVAGGGILDDHGNRYLIASAGRVTDTATLAAAPVPGTPYRIRDVADVAFGAPDPIGTASCNGRPAVVLTVSKQPDVNTLELTARLDAAVDDLRAALPPGVTLRNDVFRQADFIEVSVANLQRTLVEGAFFVVLVLLVFLANLRTTAISLVAIPVSLLASVLVLNALGYGINTMSLGGMAIAIGALVDDAIIDVENVWRRLRERMRMPEGERPSVVDVVRSASLEIRSSIVVATLIILVAFVPLFFLDGMEGRLLRPLGIAFMTSVLVSLAVAVTLTPVLCAWLLDRPSAGKGHGTTRFERALEAGYVRLLQPALRHPRAVVATAAGLFAVSCAVAWGLGRSFLPEFNEGSLVVSVVGPPAMSLAESERVGRQAEQLLLDMPEIEVVTRRTGRAELDEHAQGVNASEIDAPFVLGEGGRAEFLARVREALAQLPGVHASIGQPISHRIDHMLSGTRAAIAVKVFGPDLGELARLSKASEAVLKGIPGCVDIAPEPMAEVPELRIVPRREMLAAYGMTVGDLNRFVEQALGGAHVGTVLLGSRRRAEIVVRMAPEFRDGLEAVQEWTVDAPDGRRVPLVEVAEVRSVGTAFQVNREQVERKAVIAVNVEGRDLAAVVADIRTELAEQVPLPEGYRVELGGQFESASRANTLLFGAGVLAIFVIFLLLRHEFGEARLAGVVLINLPLALVGGIAAVALTTGVVSIASVIGFLSLFGIAARNGILLVSRYRDLANEGLQGTELLVQGARDRLNPILMTALATALALVPLALNGEAAGNEIQSPMAVVILGGLLSATFLNLFVVPAVCTYIRFMPPGAPAPDLSAAGDLPPAGSPGPG